MNDKVKAFLDEICSHISCKAVHGDIRKELAQHIDDMKIDYIQEGYDEERALENAILAMGDSCEIGNELNRQHKPQMEWSLLLLTFLIAIYGCAIMYVSSTFDKQVVSFSRYLFYAFIGLSVMLGVYFFDYTKIKNYAVSMYIVAMSLLAMTSIAGATVYGAKRWIVVGPVSISTASFASVLFTFSFIGFLERLKGEKAFGIIKLVLVGLASLLPIFAQPSLGVVFILVITYAVILLKAVLRNHFGGNKKSQLSALLGLGLMGIAVSAFFVANKPYRLQRIIGFLSRGRGDPNGAGWQQVMVDKWLFSSKLFGRASQIPEGPLDSTMPGLTSEYVLVNIVANFGWIFGIALIILITIFIIRLYMTTNKVKSEFGHYLSLSACTLLSTQFITSVLLNLNLLRTVGVDMPFVSYSGSGYVVSMLLVGTVMSIWRKNNIISNGTGTSAAAVPPKNIISFTDGKLIIDFKVRR